MLKVLACCLTLLAIAIGGPAYAQPSAKGAHPTDQHDLTLSGGDYEEILTAVRPGFRVSSISRPSTSIPG